MASDDERLGGRRSDEQLTGERLQVVVERPEPPRSTLPMKTRLVVGSLAIAASNLAVRNATWRPTERGMQLAHPMMTTDGLEGPAASHVLAVHEGATRRGIARRERLWMQN